MVSLIRDRAASSAAMLAIFGDRALLGAALRFESALAGAQAEEGLVPRDAAGRLRALYADPDIDIETLADQAAHAGTLAIPLVAHLRNRAGEDAGHIHKGATSQDLADTAMMLQARDGIALIDDDIVRLADGLGRLALRHAARPMLGRTLLQAAVPITFGLKAAQWRLSIDRARARVARESTGALALQLGGAAGTRAGLDGRGAAVAARMAAELDLADPPLPWHTRRDGIAGLAASLAILLGALGKIARDIALLAQTEVGEAFEPRTQGRGGSSSMVHKRNPTGCQIVLAAAARAPQLAATIIAAMPQEHERGLGGWQAEGAVLADLFCLAHGATQALLPVIEGLELDLTAMSENLTAAKVGTDIGESEAMAASATRTPILFLHSLGCDHTMWDHQVRALAGRCRIIAPDLPGLPTIEQIGARIIEILDDVRVGVVDVCGISLGGVLAQWLAINAPDRVGRLVLANTASRIGSHASWIERERLVRASGMAAIAETVLARFFSPAFTASHPAIVDVFRRRLLANTPEDYAACCAALRDADLTDHLPNIRCPTLVIGGSDDTSTPPAQSLALAQAIANARVLILPAAHLSNVEQPGLFNTALAEHLDI